METSHCKSIDAPRIHQHTGTMRHTEYTRLETLADKKLQMDIPRQSRFHRGILPICIFALAIAAGLPSIGGEFLSGDDYHLVRDHVLVNHPSITHAVELFTIVHRDLYQPIPLLSFSIDFAMMNALGLEPTANGPRAGAWIFHLSNILIHACTTVLVFFVVTRLAGRTVVAVVAAAVFAIHPLASEPIAWLNGRMLMLSTCFTLVTVLAFDHWNRRPRVGIAVTTLAFCAFAHMSKISMALPLVIAIATMAQRQRPSRRWWSMWIAVSALTGMFAAFNIYSSAAGQMFEKAADEMPGSPVLYTLVALAQYFRQFILPIGLSPWYPPPDGISWTQPYVVIAAITVALIVAVAIAVVPRTRVGVLGLGWFFTTVAPTLPILPARRALAADRYVYLANVGLVWIVGVVVVAAFVRLRKRDVATHRPGTPQIAFALACVAAGLAWFATSWRTQAHYRDNIALSERIIRCYPNEPSVYESAAWAYYREGRFTEAIEVALNDLERHPRKMACEVYQVVGMSHFRLGRYAEAIASLEKAIQADPNYGKCYSRLAQIQIHLDRPDDAIANYERAIEIMPFYNPAIISIAHIYRTVGRIEDAVDAYNNVLDNNRFDVNAHLALAEIDIQRNRYRDAVARLDTLLDWMPENTIARTNLGLAHERLDDPGRAIEAYTTAIDRDPHAIVATINLANLQIRRNDLKAAVATMIRARRRAPQDPHLRAWTCHIFAQATRWSEARSLFESTSDNTAISQLTETLIALHDGDIDRAVAAVDRLLAFEAPSPSDADQRLIADLERFALANPRNPWPYYLTATVLINQGQTKHAKLALDEFVRICPTQACRSRADQLLENRE